MKIPLQPSQLSSLVTRLNFEIQEHLIDSISTTVGPAVVIGWSKVGEEEHLEIRSDTKMVEILSVVVPVQIIDSMSLSVPLDGARLEAVGAWRVDSDQPWLRNHCFGDTGTLVLALPSFEPDHIKTAAITLAAAIGKYLDTQLETC